MDPQSAVPYFQGVDAILPASLTGCYGEGALIVLLDELGLASWGWLSESTSFPGYQAALAAGVVHIEQSVNPSPLPGTDLNFILKADVGQWPRPEPQPTPDPTGDAMAVGPMFTFKEGQLDVPQISAGTLWHKYAIKGVWKNEPIVTSTSGFAALTGTPQVAVIGGAAWITFEDIKGKAGAAVQPSNSTAWTVVPLP